MRENSLLDFLQDVRHPPKQILLGPTRAHGCCEMFLSAVTMSVCRASAFLPHLGFLSDVQNQLELLRHGQVLLRRLLRNGHRRRYFKPTCTPPTPGIKGSGPRPSLTTGSEISGTMLHWIFQPLAAVHHGRNKSIHLIAAVTVRIVS